MTKITLDDFLAGDDLATAIIDCLSGDLACSGAYSGTYDEYEVGGIPFWELVKITEKETAAT